MQAEKVINIKEEIAKRDFQKFFKVFMDFEDDFIKSPEYNEEIRINLLNDFYDEMDNY